MLTTLSRIVIDGVFFQLNKTGIARIWKSLLEVWAENGFAQHIVFLDRAGTSSKIPGVKFRIIPPLTQHDSPNDRALLEQICYEEKAGLFISTYYTTPNSVPSLLMIYDMIPEATGMDLNAPVWQEKHHAIRYATGYIAISQNTAQDLVRFFPEISLQSVTIAYPAADRIFSPASEKEIEDFRIQYGLPPRFFLYIGERSNYKNARLLFEAFAALPNKHDCGILCVGGKEWLEPEFIPLVQDTKGGIVSLTDEELRIAYSGAAALVFPSRYEGFGLPILEAMACGCPVITCRNDSIPEVGYDAVMYVNDSDPAELTAAMARIQDINVRKDYQKKGFEQSKKFSWQEMAEIVQTKILDMCEGAEKRSVAEIPRKAQHSKTKIEEKRRGNSKNKKQECLVSVLVSTYNSEEFIRGCLEDLEAQTIADKIEIIVINSGSQQNEEAIIEEFQEKYHNIVHVKTKRETIYAAWNRGIKLARGKYIINANTDDRHRNDAFELLINELENDKSVDLVYGDWLTTSTPNETFLRNTGDPNRILRYPEYFQPLCLLYFMLSPSPMWRKKIVKDVGLFNPNLKSAGDLEWSIKFSLKKRAKHVNQIVGLFYDDRESVSHSDAAFREPGEVYQKYRTKENVLTLYKKAGVPAASKGQRRQIFLDMATRAGYHIQPWNWFGPFSDPKFAEMCENWAREES
jgi:glycosyltransferase involved in cell wall biosynthesis